MNTQLRQISQRILSDIGLQGLYLLRKGAVAVDFSFRVWKERQVLQWQVQQVL